MFIQGSFSLLVFKWGCGSVWPNVVTTDFIDENVTFISGTVAIDGQ